MPGRASSAATAAAVGALLARYRRRAGLSQNALAKVAGRNPSAINRYESGERDRPERAAVDALAGALGLTERERDLLLVASGYAPGWAEDRTVQQLAAQIASMPARMPSVKLCSSALKASCTHCVGLKSICGTGISTCAWKPPLCAG